LTSPGIEPAMFHWKFDVLTTNLRGVKLIYTMLTWMSILFQLVFRVGGHSVLGPGRRREVKTVAFRAQPDRASVPRSDPLDDDYMRVLGWLTKIKVRRAP